jgi:alkylation response protein AidB-like acyl-CoA dehydrogenase
VTATGTTSHGLTEEERMLCATVRAFVDREVKPTVREIEHRNEYPAGWIDPVGLAAHFSCPTGRAERASLAVSGFDFPGTDAEGT